MDQSGSFFCQTLVQSNWLPLSLTNSCFVDMTDVALVCEDYNSKLVEVVTVADADAEKGIDDSLVQIWKLEFDHKTKFLFRL